MRDTQDRAPPGRRGVRDPRGGWDAAGDNGGHCTGVRGSPGRPRSSARRLCGAPAFRWLRLPDVRQEKALHVPSASGPSPAIPASVRSARDNATDNEDEGGGDLRPESCCPSDPVSISQVIWGTVLGRHAQPPPPEPSAHAAGVGVQNSTELRTIADDAGPGVGGGC